jgi:hypothetical protein
MVTRTKPGWSRTTVTLANDAMAILKRESQNQRGYGALLTQLLREYAARQQNGHGADHVARLEAIIARLEQRVEAVCLTSKPEKE